MEMAKLVGHAEVALKKDRRAFRRRQFFGKVRSVFIFLLFSTIFVYAFCNEKEFQNFVFAKWDAAAAAFNKSDHFRQSALNDEKALDDITK